MSEPAGTMRLTLEVERAAAHHLAHDLNNHLGGIDILAEMIADDTHDPATKRQIEKIRYAATVARNQVQALRVIIPKHLQGSGQTTLNQMWPSIQSMLMDQANRVERQDARPISLRGEISVIGYILYYILAHILGATTGPVTLMGPTPGNGYAQITLQVTEDFNDLQWERPFWDDVLASHDMTLTRTDRTLVLSIPLALV
jgi:hypothetical protein